MPKVSVVIPVYNVEPYLRECLDSVVNQTLRDIEIICVDDGSTDGSLGILLEYAKKDSRFCIIQQEQQGGEFCWNTRKKIPDFALYSRNSKVGVLRETRAWLPLRVSICCFWIQMTFLIWA